MPVTQLDESQGCLALALDMVGVGTALEFGVADGQSLRRIVDGMPDGSRVVGFDWFEGLPEHWRDGFGVGTFKTTPPTILGAELVLGLFDQTLPHWPVPVDLVLVHVDCDLYASTATVLEHIGPHLEPGCLILFDEFHGYPGSDDHEARAWHEWAESSGASWSAIAEGPEQLLVQLEKPTKGAKS